MAWRDEEIENAMGRLLQWGVSVAGAAMVLGGALFIVRHGGETAAYGTFHGVPPALKTAGGIFRGVRQFSARSIIQFAVLLLIATPVLRVAFAVLAFAREKDWLYALISVFVLGLLTYALWGL